MPAVLNTNMASLYAQKNLSTAQTDLATSVQRLSSGKRINSAKDDAAGFAVAEAVAATKNITDQSIRNAQDAISLVQTAEGARDVVGKILQRGLTLVSQRENSTLTTAQKDSISNELFSLLNEIKDIKVRTKFQGGSTSIFSTTPLSFTTGNGVTTSIPIVDLTLATVFSGATNGPSFTDGSVTKADADLLTSTDLNKAVQNNLQDRAALGTWQTRLNFIVDNMQTLSNNLADAKSRIMDTDFAAETASLTRGQILQQAATSMLAQANQMPNVILTLLK